MSRWLCVVAAVTLLFACKGKEQSLREKELEIELAKAKTAQAQAEADKARAEQDAPEPGAQAALVSGSGVIERISALRTKVCGCADAECAQRAVDAVADWKSKDVDSLRVVERNAVGQIGAEILACMQRVGANPYSESKQDIAEIAVKKLAYEGYPAWASAHPDKTCPGGVAELTEYAGTKSIKDPWGSDYRMFCGANLPAGAKGVAVISLGEDGKEGTVDDIKSW